MKKLNNYIFRLITALLLIFMAILNFTACNNTAADSSSTSSEPVYVETVISYIEAPYTEENAESEKTQVVSSAPVATVSSEQESVSEPEPEVESEPETAAQKTPQELILGEWSGYRDFSPDFEKLGYPSEKANKINVKLTFTESGMYRTFMRSDNFKSTSRSVVWKSFADLATEINSTPQYIEYVFRMQNGITLDEYVDLVSDEADKVWNAISEFKFADNVLLTLDPTTEQFVFCDYRFKDDNTLVITESGIENTYTRVW